LIYWFSSSIYVFFYHCCCSCAIIVGTNCLFVQVRTVFDFQRLNEKKTAEIHVKSISQLISTQNVSKQGPNLRNWIASKQWIFSWIWRLPHRNDKEIICESLLLRRVLYVIPTWLRISLSSCTSRRFTHTHSWLSHGMSYWWHLLKNFSPLIVDPAEIMWLKQCHKLPMTGNGANTTYKNGGLGDGLLLF